MDELQQKYPMAMRCRAVEGAENSNPRHFQENPRLEIGINTAQEQTAGPEGRTTWSDHALPAGMMCLVEGER